MPVVDSEAQRLFARFGVHKFVDHMTIFHEVAANVSDYLEKVIL